MFQSGGLTEKGNSVLQNMIDIYIYIYAHLYLGCSTAFHFPFPLNSHFLSKMISPTNMST